MNGINFKKALNKIESCDNVPVLLITAFITEHKEELIKAIGFKEYLVKPFINDELLFRVHNLLDIDAPRK